MDPVSRSLPAEADSVSAARRFVRETLLGWGLVAAVDLAQLLTSELATNAVIHARTVFTVDISRGGDSLRIGLTDGSPVAARVRHYDLEATTGRGIRLVQTLAVAWGVAPQRSGGKTMWFELPLDGPVSGPDQTEADDLLAAALRPWFDDVGEVGVPAPLDAPRARLVA